MHIGSKLIFIIGSILIVLSVSALFYKAFLEDFEMLHGESEVTSP